MVYKYDLDLASMMPPTLAALSLLSVQPFFFVVVVVWMGGGGGRRDLTFLEIGWVHGRFKPKMSCNCFV